MTNTSLATQALVFEHPNNATCPVCEEETFADVYPLLSVHAERNFTWLGTQPE